MLPFTKRPGRGDESGDHDVVTKDDVVAPAPMSKRNVSPSPPPSSASGGLSAGSKAGGSVRGKFASINDEEMTTLMPTKSLGDALASAKASPRPAAGMPSPRPAAGAPPPSRASGPLSGRDGGVPSSRSSATAVRDAAGRSGNFAAQDDDEEDGRTIVRGAPKIVKKRTNARTGGSAKMGMPTSPTTISPAAVIKATLESARAASKRTGDHLMAPPPKDLLEDIADFVGDARHPADQGSEHTAILQSPSSSGSGAPPPMVQGVKALSTQMLQPQAMSHGTIPPGSARPHSNPPPSLHSNHAGNASNATQSGGYNAQQSGGYAAQYNGPVPSGSVSVPGVAMQGGPGSLPAHFMVPQSPYSDARVDPPGTAVTARSKPVGRPAMSWAMAVAAFGIFVGVGAVAVMRGNDDGFMATSASFVDPSRAATPKGAAGQSGAPADQPTAVGVAPVAVPVAAPAATDNVAAPVVTTPAAATAPVAVGAAPAVAATAGAVPAVPVAAGVAPAAAAPVGAAAPAGAPGQTGKTAGAVAQAPRPAAPTRPRAPAAAPASDDNPTPAPASTRGGKGSAAAAATAAKPAPEMDDETKKALIELQKAQLERSLQ
jgi:hypothetical protein